MSPQLLVKFKLSLFSKRNDYRHCLSFVDCHASMEESLSFFFPLSLSLSLYFCSDVSLSLSFLLVGTPLVTFVSLPAGMRSIMLRYTSWIHQGQVYFHIVIPFNVWWTVGISKRFASPAGPRWDWKWIELKSIRVWVAKSRTESSVKQLIPPGWIAREIDTDIRRQFYRVWRYYLRYSTRFHSEWR